MAETMMAEILLSSRAGLLNGHGRAERIVELMALLIALNAGARRAGWDGRTQYDVLALGAGGLRPRGAHADA